MELKLETPQPGDTAALVDEFRRCPSRGRDVHFSVTDCLILNKQVTFPVLFLYTDVGVAVPGAPRRMLAEFREQIA